MFKIPHQNAPDGERDALSVRNLCAVFVDDAVYAAADRAKTQQGYLKLFHTSSYVRLFSYQMSRQALFLIFFVRLLPKEPLSVIESVIQASRSGFIPHKKSARKRPFEKSVW